jgi:mono/diheme cytochrome c family protein
MLFTRSIGIALAGMLLATTSGIALIGQAGTASQPTEKKLKKVPIPYSKLVSGEQMWKDYCAACHGMSGRGDGPAAEILKSPPVDLTLMAKQNNGKFPTGHFADVLRFGSGGHAHGTSDMPLWGPLFRSLHPEPGSKNLAELRIHNLSEYLESLQEK